MDFPRVKKKVNGFLLNEDGKISKQAAVSVGGALGVVVLGSGFTNALDFNNVDIGDVGSTDSDQSSPVKMADKANCDPKVKGNSDDAGHCWAHNNAIKNEFNDGVLKSQHQHHYNHASHSSHGSY